MKLGGPTRHFALAAVAALFACAPPGRVEPGAAGGTFRVAMLPDTQNMLDYRHQKAAGFAFDARELFLAQLGYVADKDALIKRLHRIEGQVLGIERMLEEERYCIDVLTQISAVTTALDSLALKILGDHVNSCVAHAFASGDEEAAAEKSRELLAAVERFTKTR